MTFQVSFFKDRQKFAAAHFTIFSDGEVERLHGHNYSVTVDFIGGNLEMGLMAPFHTLKKIISEVCEPWDERVLLPTENPWVRISEEGSQIQLHLETPRATKFYSFPAEDVVLLPCDNISCENLTYLFAQKLRSVLAASKALSNPEALEVTIGESSGQTVSYRQTM